MSKKKHKPLGVQPGDKPVTEIKNNSIELQPEEVLINGVKTIVPPHVAINLKAALNNK